MPASSESLSMLLCDYAGDRPRGSGGGGDPKGILLVTLERALRRGCMPGGRGVGVFPRWFKRKKIRTPDVEIVMLICWFGKTNCDGRMYVRTYRWTESLAGRNSDLDVYMQWFFQGVEIPERISHLFCFLSNFLALLRGNCKHRLENGHLQILKCPISHVLNFRGWINPISGGGGGIMDWMTKNSLTFRQD